MFCHQCGAKNHDTAKFCQRCGARVGAPPRRATGTPTPPPPTTSLVRRGIYQCKNCQHEGPADLKTTTRWSWWHYPASLLFFPFGLWYVLADTGLKKTCARCHATKLRRIRFDELPQPASLTDPDTRRNKRHRVIATFIVVGLLLLGACSRLTDESNSVSSTNAPTTASDAGTAQDAVFQADYDEGYKAGYVDGRARLNELGDSYAAPATEVRRGSYALGYLAGFVVGCRESELDCTQIEAVIRESLQDQLPDAQLQ